MLQSEAGHTAADEEPGESNGDGEPGEDRSGDADDNESFEVETESPRNRY